jgi:antitoxin YefM
MSTITYSTARDHLVEVWDKTVSTREPVIVSRRGAESIVMLPLEEWEGLQETAHLLRSPANVRRLLAALNCLDRGEGDIRSMEYWKGVQASNEPRRTVARFRSGFSGGLGLLGFH